MTQSLRKHRILLVSLLCFGLHLPGCAADKAAPGDKIGMHFDAVLEFVVEYPLTWEKDRRLPFGSASGEVHWSDPERPGVLLKISSMKLAQPVEEYSLPEHQSDSLAEDMEAVVNEPVNLPAGEATFVSGERSGVKVSSYVVSKPGRIYSITLIKPLDDTTDDGGVMKRVTQSFRIISQE